VEYGRSILLHRVCLCTFVYRDEYFSDCSLLNFHAMWCRRYILIFWRVVGDGYK
jgi:hypothetical protein